MLARAGFWEPSPSVRLVRLTRSGSARQGAEAVAFDVEVVRQRIATTVDTRLVVAVIAWVE